MGSQKQLRMTNDGTPELPTDMWKRIFDYLPEKDAQSLALTSDICWWKFSTHFCLRRMHELTKLHRIRDQNIKVSLEQGTSLGDADVIKLCNALRNSKGTVQEFDVNFYPGEGGEDAIHEFLRKTSSLTKVR